MAVLELARAERARRAVAVAGPVEQRATLTLEQLLADEATPTAAGISVNAASAMQHSTVWRCVTLLADCVSTLPLHVYRVGERDPLPALPPILAQPSARADTVEFLGQVLVSLLLRGNAYAVVVDRAGPALRPAQLEVINPDRVSVTAPEGTVTYRLDGVEQDPGDVWHVRRWTPPGGLEGLSPIAHARQAVGLGLGIERFGAKLFGDAGIPAGVLTSDQHINQEAAENMQARWDERHKGNRRIAVLGGGAKFQHITIAPEESQFLESSKANVATIARYYGVPAELVNGETAGPLAYTSPEMRAMDLLTFTVAPWLVVVERALSRLLPRTQKARFNPDGIVRVDLKTRYEAHAIGIASGFLLKNEARDLEDRPPLPEPAPGGIA